MGRPRGFDEAEVIRAAAALFAGRVYDGVSVDDLVSHLGVHRNSLYKTFGSKRGLYLAALRHSVRHDVTPLLTRVGAAGSLPAAVREVTASRTGEIGLDLLLLAAVERAPIDAEVATEVAAALAALDQALAAHTDNPTELTATVLGLRLRARING
jgi:TetR/AcrR family transcriptional repressor of nem operon